MAQWLHCLPLRESQEIAAVIADGAYPTGEGCVREHQSTISYMTSGTRLWLRVLYLIASCPGVSRAVALVYYARTGIYLGSELCVCPSIRLANQDSSAADIRRAGLDCADRTDANNTGRPCQPSENLSLIIPNASPRHHI